MLQRFLFAALEDGLDQITDDPTLLDQLFDELYELVPDEVAAIKTAFAAKPPKVIHGYAPRDIDPPVYSIVLQAESEVETFLNDDGVQVTDVDDPDFGADVKSSIWQHSYHILTYTEHPDLTAYYYEIAKGIFLASTRFFVDRGMFDTQISGEDLMPDPQYVPEHLFARRMVFQTKRLFERVDRESLSGKAFRIEGIHVDKTGSRSDVGGVKTLVTPVTQEELEDG